MKSFLRDTDAIYRYPIILFQLFPCVFESHNVVLFHCLDDMADVIYLSQVEFNIISGQVCSKEEKRTTYST